MQAEGRYIGQITFFVYYFQGEEGKPGMPGTPGAKGEVV